MKIDGYLKFGLLGVAAYAVYKLLNPKGTGTPELDVPGGGGLTDTEALNIAQRLLAAMNQAGTNEDILFSNLENLTGPQLVSVYNKFGRPPYWAWGFDALLGTPIDLFGWFERELGGADLSRMRDIWLKSGLLWI